MDLTHMNTQIYINPSVGVASKIQNRSVAISRMGWAFCLGWEIRAMMPYASNDIIDILTIMIGK